MLGVAGKAAPFLFLYLYIFITLINKNQGRMIFITIDDVRSSRELIFLLCNSFGECLLLKYK
jgi:hypothetical protein